MPLQSACTNLVRYMEDNRDNFRGKPRTESWTKFLLGDLYARHMIDQIVLAAKDYKSQAKALVTDGYATDPDYSTKLINLIEQYNLNKYDN